MTADDLVTKAKAFALKVHEGQWLYNVPGIPISTHLTEVARLVEEAGGRSEEIAAAWLHDTVEDTAVTLDQLQSEFGSAVAEIVEGLTDPPGLDNNGVTAHKQSQAERVVKESDSVKLVKLADQAFHTRMAGTSHRSFDAKTCLEFVEGARLVANGCRGVSPRLDAQFDEYYENSKKQLLSEIA